MCGIFGFSSSDTRKVQSVFSKKMEIVETIRLRGPDRVSYIQDSNFVAIHTLLSMTGEFRDQPITTDEFVLMYNGEIYNDYERYRPDYGDADYLVNQIQEHGIEELNHLDGEFAICLKSFTSNSFYLMTDPFGTKPIYYQVGEDFCLVGTYESTIRASGLSGTIHQVPPNSLVTIALDDFSIRVKSPMRAFDFTHANIDTFETWNHAFAEAIRKRTTNSNHQCYVCFSSGHDSGVIAAELLAQHIPFGTYTIPFKEDLIVLEARLDLLKNRGIPMEVLTPSEEELLDMKEFVLKHCDPFLLLNTDSGFQNFPDPDMRKISGCIGASILFQRAKQQGRLISLSGQGGDEIFSDYYNKHSNPAMSEIRGQWHKVHGPWQNFYGGWNRVFLGAGERIAGMFGIETRYPLLDFQVVQEFLNLSPHLKSSLYKAPITNRLQDLQFPYHERKMGFAAYDDSQLRQVHSEPQLVGKEG